ncbi:MAG: hypothetical protein ACRDGA_03425 [Bacteroidota bacterium]
MLRFFSLALIVLSLMGFVFENAWASCGSASCPLNNHRHLKSGWLHVGLVREYINQDQIYIGSQKSFVGAIQHHHDEVQTINERSIVQLQAGLTDRAQLNVEIPFVTRQHSHIHHHHDEDLWESWSFNALGDIVLGGQYALFLPGSEFAPYVSILVGVKLPTGLTNVRNAEGEAAEVSIQPGSGSTDGIIGLQYRQTVVSIPTISGEYSSLPVEAAVTYQFNGAGTNGWRFGNILLAHAGTSYQFSQRASLLLQVNGRIQAFADPGSTGEPLENTGGTWIFASPGLSVQLIDAILGFVFIQIPVYRNVHGIQQTSAFNLQVGLSAKIGLLE